MDRFTKAIEQARRTQRKEAPLFKSDQFKVVELSAGVLRDSKVVDQKGSNVVADSYRLLRTRVLQRMRQSDWNILGISSTSPGAGKTLTAINLAMAIAMETNQPVILVDADLRNPSVCRVLGIPEQPGLVDYVKSGIDAGFQNFLLKTSIDNLFVFPCTKKAAATSEVLTSPKVRKFVEELRLLKPSFVVFDLPPIFVGDDVVAFSSHLDAILLVVEDGKTKAQELKAAVELLDQTTVLGTVLNKARSGSSEHYYGHYGGKDLQEG